MAPSSIFWASAVLPNGDPRPRPSAASAGLPGWTPPRTVVRNPETSSPKKSPRSAGNAASAPPESASGPTKWRTASAPRRSRGSTRAGPGGRPRPRPRAGAAGARAPRRRAPRSPSSRISSARSNHLGSRKRGRHEPADRRGRRPTDGLGADPPAERPGQVRDVPPPGRAAGRSVLEPPRQREEQQPGHPEHRVQREEPQQREEPVVLQHRGQRRALRVVARAPWRCSCSAARRGRSRRGAGAREGRHQHAEPGEPRPPAEVEVLVVAREALVERPRPLPDLARDQHHAPRTRTGPRGRGRTAPGRSPRPAAACTGGRTGRWTARPRAGPAARPSRRPSGRRCRRARRPRCPRPPRRAARRRPGRGPRRRAAAGGSRRPARPGAGRGRQRAGDARFSPQRHDPRRRRAPGRGARASRRWSRCRPRGRPGGDRSARRGPEAFRAATAAASRTTSTTSTVGERTSSDGGRSIDGCRGHEGALEAAASLARRCFERTRKGGDAPLPSMRRRSDGYRFFAVRLFGRRLRAAVFLRRGFLAAGFLRAVFLRGRLLGGRLARGGLLARCRLLGRRLARGGRLLRRRLAPRVVFLAVDFFAAGLRAAVFLLGAWPLARRRLFRFGRSSCAPPSCASRPTLFFAGAIGHPLSIGLRTPSASGVAAPVRSCLPTPRTARRGGGRS